MMKSEKAWKFYAKLALRFTGYLIVYAVSWIATIELIVCWLKFRGVI